jgi:hypothetical protein
MPGARLTLEEREAIAHWRSSTLPFVDTGLETSQVW